MQIKGEHQAILMFNVRSLRKLKGFSQTKLATSIGRTRDAIRHIEQQGYIANRDLLKIAEVFGVDKPNSLLQNRLEIKLGEQTLKL